MSFLHTQYFTKNEIFNLLHIIYPCTHARDVRNIFFWKLFWWGFLLIFYCFLRMPSLSHCSFPLGRYFTQESCLQVHWKQICNYPWHGSYCFQDLSKTLDRIVKLWMIFTRSGWQTGSHSFKINNPSKIKYFCNALLTILNFIAGIIATKYYVSLRKKYIQKFFEFLSLPAS